MLFLDSHRYTLCCECVNDEFIYITPLSVFGTVFVGIGALVSNNGSRLETRDPESAGDRILNLGGF